MDNLSENSIPSISDIQFYPVGFYFYMTAKGIAEPNQASFKEVSGINIIYEQENINEASESKYVHKLPESQNYSNLVLKRGMIAGSALASWVTESINTFKFTPKTVIVSLLNEKGAPLVTWSFLDAYPVSIKLSDLKSQDGSIICESLELAYTSFERIV